MSAYFSRMPLFVEALTFTEFVQYGIEHAENLVNGEPWSFKYNGIPVTQENSEMYLIPHPKAGNGFYKFTPSHMLVNQQDGTIEVVRIEDFEKRYGFIEDNAPYIDFVSSTPVQLAEKLLKASCCYCVFGKGQGMGCRNKTGTDCKAGIFAYLTGQTLD